MIWQLVMLLLFQVTPIGSKRSRILEQLLPKKPAVPALHASTLPESSSLTDWRRCCSTSAAMEHHSHALNS